METKIYFTEAGYELFTKKIKDDEDRIAEMSSRLGYLAEVGGDQYHDNFSYEQQTMELRMLTKKIKDDKSVLDKAIIIDSSRSGKVHDAISIGSIVITKFDNNEKSWEIVGYGESDPKNYKVAYNTPLGAAFIGRHKGESFNYTFGSKIICIHIIDIK